MKGKIGSNGTVVIAFNRQFERLPAPGGLQWLPCDGCGKVEAVEENVVAYACGECWEREGGKSAERESYDIGHGIPGRNE